MTALAPIARLALAYGGGVGAGLLGVPGWATLLAVLLGVAAPDRASRGPIRIRTALLLTFLAGAGAGYADGRGATGDFPPGTDRCRGGERVRGRFLSPPIAGSAALERPSGCGRVTVVLRSGGIRAVSGDDGTIRAGVPVVVHGRWREGRLRPWFQADSIRSDTEPAGGGSPSEAQRVSMDRVPVDRVPVGGGVDGWARGREAPATLESVRWAAIRWRGAIVLQMHALFGPRAPLVTALTLARTEGLDRDLRRAFAGAGIAHLLAISGFHVGVFAALVSVLLSAVPWPPRRKRLVAVMVTGAYVALIGFPVAACRAALIFALVSMSAAVGRPPSRWAALGAAALIILVIDPGELGRAGFQLSFAGAAGLIAWSRPIEAAVARSCRRIGTLPLPRSLVSAVAAGIAATAATLPFVAWHFERVALLGIPATLVATPLVTAALPGALLATALSWVSPDAAGFIAGGVTILLDALSAVARAAGGAHFASAWIARPSVLAAVVGCGWARRVSMRPGIGAAGRRRLTVCWTLAGILSWPLLLGLASRGSVDVWMIDVGQGDAIAVRTPHGRWMLVDAGPPTDEPTPGQPVVRTLRAAGARRIDLLVVTHADADHFGGAPGVLRAFDVGRVMDPAVPVGKAGYGALLREARSTGVPWLEARAGSRLELDGVVVEVLHPSAAAADAATMAGSGVDANAVSVVMRVSWNGVVILLTGDAYVDVEGQLAEEIGDVDVLKVGHHGSSTSTGEVLLNAVRPEYALLSVGRGNRYGHPTPTVLQRLAEAGTEVYRTDQHGTVRLGIDGDGLIRVRTER